MLFTDLLGTAAAVLTTLSFLPQVAKTWRTQSAADFSWIWIGGFGVGLFLWLAYGVAIASVPLIAANGLTLALVMTIAFVKWRQAD